jgi:membrane protease YdiL (CAAX protease family)
MGTPAPPYGPQFGHGYAFPHPPPPDPPELPEPASRWPAWPWWYGPAAMGIAFMGTLIVVAVIAAIATAAGAKDVSNSKGFLQFGTIAQELIFVAVAVFLAARTVRPRLWHFGLRPARFWPTLGWAALGFAVYWVLAIVYSALVSSNSDQKTLEDLGTKDGKAWLVGAALVVITCAPVAEELFFRGFFYRALRTRLPVALAAIADGALFGGIHVGSTPAEVLPVLMILGVIFCLVYERTGTLFSTICLHALNNTLAFGVSTHEWAVGGAVGGLTIGGAILAARLLSAHPAPRGRSAMAPNPGRT